MDGRSPIELLEGALAGLAATDVSELSDAQVAERLPVLLAAVNSLNAITAAVVSSFDARDLCELDGWRTTRAWLTAFGRMSHGAASGWLARGRLLRQMPGLARAAAGGAVSTEQLGVVGRLADRTGVAEVTRFDDILADLASHTGPAEVAMACRRIHVHLDPDGAAPDPYRDADRRGLTLSRSGTAVYLRGRLDAEGGAALRTALDAFTTPPTGDDQRTPAQRRADALVELARTALTNARTPTIGGVRPHLGILISPSVLLAGTGADLGVGAAAGADSLTAAGVPPRARGWLDWIGDVPPELARRLACDSDVWRVILDPATGRPLDLGRTHRLVPHHLRKALHARDRGCRWPGCTAPTPWTDAHHLTPWYAGGGTAPDNLVLMCRWHHMLVHEGRWRLEHDYDTGELRVYRPDGRPYELGPSQPWRGPTARRCAAARSGPG